YINIKKSKPSSYNFENFLEDFIGYEDTSGSIDAKFYKLIRSVSQYLNLNRIEVISTSVYQEDRIIEEVARKFSRQISGPKKEIHELLIMIFMLH
ncbi:hypothetical protein, partial [Escherichia coli]